MRSYQIYSLAFIAAFGLCATAVPSFAEETKKAAEPTKAEKKAEKKAAKAEKKAEKKEEKKAEKKAAAIPVGRVHFMTHSADFGVGYTWGDGTLTFQGKRHHFSIKGGNIAALGYSKINATGEVFNLKHLYDFDGEYGAASGEATFDKGVGAAVLSNTNGVRLKITSSNRGARLAASLQGLQFKLKD